MATRKPQTPAAGPADRGLQIVSRPASFWRCGRQFSAEPTVIALSELSEDEVATLKAEPMLAVAEVAIGPVKE
jgi:hypothetical protein